jgi:hypothetical protein
MVAPGIVYQHVEPPELLADALGSSPDRLFLCHVE